MPIDYYTAWGLVLSSWSIFLAIIIPFIYVSYTIKSQYKENYNAALDKLLVEMMSNHRKMHNFQNDLNVILRRWENRNYLSEAWLPKSPSFGLHRYVLHYLPSKAFYNFMNRGYFLRLEDGRLEHLLEFYFRCIQFSEDTTRLEVSINDLEKSDENFGAELARLVQQIRIGYISAMNGFDYHYEGQHGFNPQNRDGLEIIHWYNV
jgi:hypothetical protein